MLDVEMFACNLNNDILYYLHFWLKNSTNLNFNFGETLRSYHYQLINTVV